ncbi:phage baseplate assembly protein V [Endozoicomonas sp. SCSIO W0465]|uniref:phage baseplate assembly protein V n=1 Tax=Endozoicomonas sp. SCSIO W0465 TaxID=2918516 RepID=UPI00207574BE|nr:phage baseplate assembly protein V [Endozoicomonas sp. SCSIO W0465]USE38927.1 phage baseplate assembly protein V [Endozoicomonas sp. SCSIO W0465]
MNWDISELYRLLNNLIQFAKVDSIKGDRVVCITADGLKTKPLPVGVDRAGDDRTSWLPSKGEQVLIFSPGGVTEHAVVGPSLWADAFPAPSVDPKHPMMQFSDGAKISYHKGTHTLSALLPAGAKVNIVASGGLAFTGDLTVNGNIKATGDITDQTRSMKEDRAIYNGHNHIDSMKGNTSSPKQSQ